MVVIEGAEDGKLEGCSVITVGNTVEMDGDSDGYCDGSSLNTVGDKDGFMDGYMEG